MKSHDILLLLKLFSLSRYEKMDIKKKHISGLPFENEIDEKKYNLEILYRTLHADYNKKFLNNYFNQIENLYNKIDFNLLFEDNKYSLLSLEASTGISKSQISLSIRRCTDLRLLLIRNKVPYVNTQELFNTVIPALRFFFPIRKLGIVRGIPISYSSPFLYEEVLSGKTHPMVWADSNGSISGEAIEPLYKTAPYAAKQDPLLYELLVLIDSIRLNTPREKQIASERLKKILIG